MFVVVWVVSLSASACDASEAGGADGQYLGHVPVAQLRETKPDEGVLPALAQRRGVRDMPVHLVGHGSQLLELKARRWPLHLYRQVRGTRIAQPVVDLQRDHRLSHRFDRTGMYVPGTEVVNSILEHG